MRPWKYFFHFEIEITVWLNAFILRSIIHGYRRLHFHSSKWKYLTYCIHFKNLIAVLEINVLFLFFYHGKKLFRGVSVNKPRGISPVLFVEVTLRQDRELLINRFRSSRLIHTLDCKFELEMINSAVVDYQWFSI